MAQGLIVGMKFVFWERERQRGRERQREGCVLSIRASCHLGLCNGTKEASVLFGSSGISDALPVWGLSHLWGLSGAAGLSGVWGWSLTLRDSLLLWCSSCPGKFLTQTYLRAGWSVFLTNSSCSRNLGTALWRTGCSYFYISTLFWGKTRTVELVSPEWMGRVVPISHGCGNYGC